MKKNIEYYPHKTESHRHPKFKMLRSTFGNGVAGWAAEGRFWALNNIIASSEDCQLNLTKKRNRGVYADELGMSINEFDEFIEMLKSEDIELIKEVSPGVYITDIVLETYDAVSRERQTARSRQSKKEANITDSGEELENSDEELENSGEPNNKVNGSEVNKSKLKGSEVNSETSTSFKSSDLTTSLTEYVTSLYKEFTKISDPNINLHIKTILKELDYIPETLTESDIRDVLHSVFSTLSKSQNIRVDILATNIQRAITIKNEKTLNSRKKAEMLEAVRDRDREIEAEREVIHEKMNKYKEFYESNKPLFSNQEKTELIKFISKGNLLQAGAIIEPKIESMGL